MNGVRACLSSVFIFLARQFGKRFATSNTADHFCCTVIAQNSCHISSCRCESCKRWGSKKPEQCMSNWACRCSGGYKQTKQSRIAGYFLGLFTLLIEFTPQSEGYQNRDNQADKISAINLATRHFCFKGFLQRSGETRLRASWKKGYGYSMWKKKATPRIPRGVAEPNCSVA